MRRTIGIKQEDVKQALNDKVEKGMVTMSNEVGFLKEAFQGNEEFYPTPPDLLERMFSKMVDYCKEEKKLRWEYQRFEVLEPSAGKGNIIDYYRKNVGDYHCPKVDAIEPDQILRQVLKSNDNCNLIWDNFLTFRTEKHYDLIAMNPPFSEGSKHLMRAIDIAEQNGGDTIVMCILNAETILNPYTNERKALSVRLSQLHADIEIIEEAFSEAERSSDVRVALIFIDVPKSFSGSLILDKLEKAKEYEEQKGQKSTEIVTAENYIEQMIAFYDREVELCAAFLQEYFSIAPFIKAVMPENYEPTEEYYNQLKEEAKKSNSCVYEDTPVLRVKIGKHDIENYKDINKAIQMIRYKYWNHLFHNEEFTKLLTSDMRQELYNSVNEMKVYDFNAYNIKVVQEQFIADLLQSLEETIIKLFEQLTCEHTYFDGSQNIHYYNGWKSNKAHKVNKKVIIPMYGAFYEWKFSSRFFNCYELTNKISDLEKVFNYLSDGTTEGLPVENIVYWADKQQKNRNLHFKYFDASIYKKGTCHLKFTDEAVVDALNIYVGKHRGWLPPSYGKVTYDEMNDEEKAVIDDFQGREEYEKVLANPSKYLFETSTMLALPAKT